MIRKTAATLLLLACSAAHAETGWIEVMGFYDVLGERDRPDLVLSGGFKGTDADHDGVLRTNEVESFNFNSMQYIVATPGTPGSCAVSGLVCTLDFEYAIGSGTANFAITETYIDQDTGLLWRAEFATGVGYSFYYRGDPPYVLRWADYTTMTVTSVPEPSAASMLLLGLAGAGAVARRRRG